MKSPAPAVATPPRARLLEQRRQQREDQRARRRQPAIEVDGSDHRLAGVGEQHRLLTPAGLVLTPAEPQVRAEVDVLGHARQRRERHQRRLDLALLPLVALRKLLVHEVGDDEAEHRIAEEFERLVGRLLAEAVLVRTRSMRERVFEQAAVAKAIAETDARAAPRSSRSGTTLGPTTAARSKRRSTRWASSASSSGTLTRSCPKNAIGTGNTLRSGERSIDRREALGFEQSRHQRRLGLGRGGADHRAPGHAARLDDGVGASDGGALADLQHDHRHVVVLLGAVGELAHALEDLVAEGVGLEFGMVLDAEAEAVLAVEVADARSSPR